MVRDAQGLADAYTRASSEANAAFGSGALYVEQYVGKAKHIEVQIIGDGSGRVSHVWERECSVQRRHQKIVEIAPSSDMPVTIVRLKQDPFKIRSGPQGHISRFRMKVCF